jgi:hypothetical protein
LPSLPLALVVFRGLTGETFIAWVVLHEPASLDERFPSSLSIDLVAAAFLYISAAQPRTFFSAERRGYDVELFQRIEDLIGQKMELYKTEEEAVLMLLERVAEAQRLAAMVRSH